MKWKTTDGNSREDGVLQSPLQEYNQFLFCTFSLFHKRKSGSQNNCPDRSLALRTGFRKTIHNDYRLLPLREPEREENFVSLS